jgi:hypothetical protein
MHITIGTQVGANKKPALLRGFCEAFMFVSM